MSNRNKGYVARLPRKGRPKSSEHIGVKRKTFYSTICRQHGIEQKGTKVWEVRCPTPSSRKIGRFAGCWRYHEKEAA